MYFISELKDHLNDTYVDELRRCGVRLDSRQIEQHMRYQMKGIYHPPSTYQEVEEDEPDYTWETVSTWKYDKNICLLYDEKGKLLDTPVRKGPPALWADSVDVLRELGYRDTEIAALQDAGVVAAAGLGEMAASKRAYE